MRRFYIISALILFTMTLDYFLFFPQENARFGSSYLCFLFSIFIACNFEIIKCHHIFVNVILSFISNINGIGRHILKKDVYLTFWTRAH